MLFKYTVKYYDDALIEHRKAKGKAFSTTYGDVAQDLIEYYDNNAIESISIKLVDDTDCVWEESNDKVAAN